MLILRLKTEVSLDGLGRRCKGVGGGDIYGFFFWTCLGSSSARRRVVGLLSIWYVGGWVYVCGGGSGRC